MSDDSPIAASASLARLSHSCAIAAALLLGLSGCGLGTAALASSSDGGGASNAPPSMSGFAVQGPEAPPATLRFVISDAEGNPASVEFYYQAPGFEAERMVHLPTLPANPAQLQTSPQGIEYAIPWDFAAEDLLPDDASFLAGVLVYARVEGAPNAILPGVNSQLLGLGNDPPVLTVDDPPSEVDGVVPVRLHVSDSSSDALDIRVEYQVQGEADDPWLIARPAGLLPGAPTPEYAFEGIVADDRGSDIVFFWDTDFDLADLERDVRLRITPIDPVVSGSPALTRVFRVDNNAAPILQLYKGAFLANPDSVRGIPVPFTVIDEESDEITVVFQWRREGGSFPALPDEPAQIDAILADEDLRRQHQVCSRYPREFEGRALQVDATRVRMPELWSELSFLVQLGLEGREIEFLRPSNDPAAVSDGWSSNPLARPVAVLPLHRGSHAIVLDEAASGTWRLVEVRLQDGLIESTLATGRGAPSALCFERDEESVLVASSDGSAWRVDRVDLAAGATTRLADATNGPVEQGEVRGIASIGTNAAVLTVGSSLVLVDWSASAAPRALAVLTGLAKPWGVVADPRYAGTVLVAENEAATPSGPGRVVTVDLATRTLRPVVIQPNPADGLAFRRPRGIALLRKGARILAACETDRLFGQIEIRGVDLARADTSAAFSVGGQTHDGVAALAASWKEDVWLSTSATSRLVLAAGGVARRGTIESLDAGTATATLASVLEPALAPGARWRLARPDDAPFRFASDPQGLAQVFTWDSADVPEGGNVFLRATPLDAEMGSMDSSTGPKRVSEDFHVDPVALTGIVSPAEVLLVDLDMDGDLDLVSANHGSDTLTVFWQTAPRTFDPVPTTVGGPSTTDGPLFVLAADVDGDGDLDLVSANELGNCLTVFWRTATRTFDPNPTTVGGPSTTGAPYHVVAADFDEDGDLDLISANQSSDTLTVFWQTGLRTFDPVPTTVGGSSTTDGPNCVLAVDLDGDGDLDLVSANWFARTLTVFWRTAILPTSFDPLPTTLVVPSTTTGVHAVQAADLDGDGDLDLVSANNGQNAGSLTVFWQTAPGTFDPIPSSVGGPSTTDGPDSVQAADLDGDGDLDLLSANYYADNLTVFWQSTPGTFDPTPTRVGGTSTTNGPFCARAADLDGDGDLDLVSANYDAGTLTVFWQTAPGSFDPTPTRVGGPSTTNNPSFVQAADLDGDGDLDLVSANQGGNNLTVFWQTTPGVLDATPTTVGGLSTTASPRCVQAADLDGDGDLDLVSANWVSDTLTVFWQTAPRTFDPAPTTLGGSSTTDGPMSVLAADVDGDGDLDLISANQLGNTSTVFWQIGLRTFDPIPTTLGGASTTRGPYHVQAADLDGDGDLDLVSANQIGNTLTVFWQIGLRTFDPVPTTLGGPSTTNAPNCVQAADLDGDGDLDLVSANWFANTLTVFWQTASSPTTFHPTPTTLSVPSTTTGVRYVQAADLDGDGDLDLVSANNGQNAGSLTVFWQTAPGAFDPIPSSVSGLSTTDGPNSVQAVDLDGDGDLDLLSANFYADNLTVFGKWH